MLTTPTPPHYAIIDRSALAITTKRQYKQALDRLALSGTDPRNREALLSYAASLPNSGRAFLKAALKLILTDTAQRMKAGATPENIAQVQAALLNIEALTETIQVSQPKGTKAHTWLTPEQVTLLTSLDRNLPTDRRDFIALALLLHGLRRDEAARAHTDDITIIPTQGKPVAWLNITGKGGKDRAVPLHPDLYAQIQAGGTGNLIRSMQGDTISGQGIQNIVTKHGTRIGFPCLQPHDLRRTFAMVLWEQTRNLALVMVRLGHSDPDTTMKYLNLKALLDMDTSTLFNFGG